VTPFIHFHKFSYLPGFRIQIGIRVMNDLFAAIAPNRAGKGALGRILGTRHGRQSVRVTYDRVLSRRWSRLA